MLKALTFSYDDNVRQDVRMIEILNKYGLKCTFNINSALLADDSSFNHAGHAMRRIGKSEAPAVYAGHEAAVHSMTHPHLEKMTRAEVEREIRGDKEALEAIFGYDIVGMAYPYGTYNDMVIDVIAQSGIKYARTVGVTRGFSLPKNLLLLDSTCHHNEPTLMGIAKRFVEAKPEEPMLFYVWGHSYEFDFNDGWGPFEDFCAYISGRDDILYCSNTDALKHFGVL